MGMIKKMSIACFATTTLSVFAFSGANAADQNTYRPGTPYLKTSAKNYTDCAQQCRGDASCRGWNFVRPNPGAMTGICEFNSRQATPISSPMSMSGSISTNVDPMMSQAVAGGTNTIRVGTPPAPKPQVRPQMLQDPRFAQQQNQQFRGQTRVNRQAVPQRHTPSFTNHVTPQHLSPQQRQFQIQAQQRAEYERQMAYQQQQYRMRELQMKRQQMQQGFNAPAPAGLMQQQNAQVPANLMQQMNQQQNVQVPQYAPQPQPMPQMQSQPLYGSLHDDLTQNMTHVPRPQTAPDNTFNPNAPMATSRAVPSIPVEISPMGYPAIPGLAGG